PRIGDVRFHFGVEVGLRGLLDRLVGLRVVSPAERDVLGVAQCRVRLKVALVLARLYAAVVGGVIVDADRLPQLLALCRRETNTVVAKMAAELFVELLPV